MSTTNDFPRGISCIKDGTDRWRLNSAGHHQCIACKSRIETLRRHVLRALMLEEYGGKCQCPGGCDVTEPAFLTIDHVDGGGRAHRREIGGTSDQIALFLKRLGWPKIEYRLLCWNCNSGRQQNGGICPHEEQGQLLTLAGGRV